MLLEDSILPSYDMPKFMDSAKTVLYGVDLF